MKNTLKKGDKIWFGKERKSFIVRESKGNFAIVTQNRGKVYTIIDFKRNVNGVDDKVIDPYYYSRDEDCRLAIDDLVSGKLNVSRIEGQDEPLNITKILHIIDEDYLWI